MLMKDEGMNVKTREFGNKKDYQTNPLSLGAKFRARSNYWKMYNKHTHTHGIYCDQKKGNSSSSNIKKTVIKMIMKNHLPSICDSIVSDGKAER